MSSALTRFQTRSNQLAKWSTVFAAFSITTTTSGTALAFILVGLFWLLSGNFRQKYLVIKQNPVAVSALALYFLFILGISYSPSSLSHSIGRLGAYTNSLLFIPVFITLLDSEVWRRRVGYSFLAGMFITLILSYLIVLGLIPEQGSAPGAVVFHSRITQSYFMAFAIFVVMAFWYHYRNEFNKYSHIIIAIVMLFAILDIFFFVGGRTGQLVLLVAGTFLMSLLYRWKGLLLGIIAFLIIITSAFFFSTTFQGRITETETEIARIKGGDYGTKAADSGTGIRLKDYEHAALMILDNPIFGVGTGGVNLEVSKYEPRKDRIGTQFHPEFAMVGAELGIIGLMALICIFYMQWRYAYKLDAPYRILAKTGVVGFVTGGIVLTVMLDANEGHFFGLYSGLIFSALPSANNIQDELA